MELVAYPRILFLDEPTSGLDSSASCHVVDCLSKMRKLGMTIISVIHQPAYSAFSMFTHCLLLAPGGKTTYLGPTEGVLEYFLRLGYRYPAGDNVADWMLSVVAGNLPRISQDDKHDENPESSTPDFFRDQWIQVRRVCYT
jgi:ABC-type multidrug transport system ATPase subunit